MSALRQRIRIDICDFFPNYPKTENIFFKWLNERFDVQICDQLDFLLYGPYGHEHRLHSGIRIFVSGEPGAPDFSACDYSISCLKLDDPRHLQLPNYVPYGEAEEILKRRDKAEQILAAKTKFCSFIVSSHNPGKNRNRPEFFQRLSQYKPVDSGGSRGKIDFLRAYKFNIAFENGSQPGYTTEKIFEPMIARCLPIYWGNPLIHEEFNPRSFLNHADYPSDEALIEKIIELDRDDAKYLEFLRQPYFHNDQPNCFSSHARLQDFFERIVSEPIVPVAQRRRRKWFSIGRWIVVKRHHWHPAPEPRTPKKPSPPAAA